MMRSHGVAIHSAANCANFYLFCRRKMPQKYDGGTPQAEYAAFAAAAAKLFLLFAAAMRLIVGSR
jgi:hypothetical protein